MKKKEKDLVKQQKKEERKARESQPSLTTTARHLTTTTTSTPKARRRRERGEDTGAITASSKAPSEMTDGEEEPDDGRGDGRREGYDEDEIRLPTRMMPAMQFGQWVPVRIGHYAPPASFGHAMCLCGTDVFVYGGRTRDDALDTFHSFPGAPVPWRSVPYDGDGPGARVSHAMLMLEHYMYVLGGGGGNRSFNDLRRLDLYTMHWELLETKGEGPDEKPDALIGHSVSWVEPYVVVFGGGDGRKPSNDLHTLDLRTLLWKRVQTEGAPPAPRVGHSSTQLGSEMWVFGGFSKGKYFHDVHVLDVEQLEWRQVIVAGTPPHGRVSHSATLYNGQIHIFGGSAGGHCYNDYIVLKPGKPTDADISNSSPPKGRASGSVPSHKKVNANASAVWLYPETVGAPPAPRFSHSATVIGDTLFVLGGNARKGRAFGDVFLLDLKKKEWSLPRVTFEGPSARGRHTAAAVGSLLLVYGGGAEGHVFDDLWALDTDGHGMLTLEKSAATHAVAVDEEAAAEDEEEAAPLDGTLALAFLAPHIGEGMGPGEREEEEYEDVEARAADADEVRSWLQHLGLAEHAYTFEAHEIDLEVLLELQEHDLRDMGVHDPTQRMQLLRGIGVLRARGALSALGRAPGDRIFRDRYRLGAEVNFGGAPAVLAVDGKTDLKVAVKFVGGVARYHELLGLHARLKGEWLVRLVDSFAANNFAASSEQTKEEAEAEQAVWLGKLPCLVLEYGDASLADVLGRGLLGTTERKAVFEAVARCVSQLHEKGLAHCALQPDSFRLYAGTRWRLVALDTATALGQPGPRHCAVAYAAPEVVRKLRAASPCEASTAQDVWSLGMILWQMYSQQPLWGNEAEALAALGGAGLSQQHRLDPPMGCVTDVQARHLIGRMLQRKPAERIDVAHILRHGYLSGGMDTVEMDETFGPLHKGFVFARSLLQQQLNKAGIGS